jgi:HlyD family secretion protein
MFKKISIPVIVLLSLTALVLASCSGTGGATGTPAPTAASGSSAGGGVIAEGRIVPKDSADLFFQTGGLVDQVLVKEGDHVTKGTPLVSLADSRTAQSDVAAAQAELVAAQQAVDDLTRTADLAYQQAVLDEITAQTAYYDAQAKWDAFDPDAQQTKIDDQQAKVNTAASDLKDAQTEFDKYAALDTNNADRQRTKTALDNAAQTYHEAQSALADLQNEGAKLQADLSLAKDQLDEAARDRVQRKDGPDPDQLSLAQARLDSAKAALTAAQFALDNMTLVAPYDGVVASLDVSAGERVAPDAPVISFADFSQWYVETTDLNENEVVDIAVGQKTISVPDALPETDLSGTVESIAQAYTEKSGDIVYKTRIRLADPGDVPLRWGMTVEVRFAGD